MSLRIFLAMVLAALTVLTNLPAQEAAPIYPDKADLLYYLDAKGARHPVRTPEAWKLRAGHVLANMQRVMGPLPSSSTLPLDIRVMSETRLRHYTRRHLTFVAEKGDRVPAYLLVPHGEDGKKFPAMVCLPESDRSGKDLPAGLTPKGGLAYAHELAQRGYVAIVIDYPLLHTREYKTDPYTLGYVSATMKGVVNHRRAIDLLESLPFVDREAIGVIGHSLGGHNSLFLAAFDSRVKAVVSSCGFNVFAKHNKGDVRAWSSRYYMPRIKTEFGDDPKRIPFDFTEVLGVLAPRAVFVNAPLRDAPDFEVSGVRDCVTAALPVYRDLFKAQEKLVVRYPDAGHEFPADVRLEAYDFLDRQLKNTGGAVRLDADLLGRWRLQKGKPDVSSLSVGAGDFSVSVWLKADAVESAGDLVSHLDTTGKTGWQLSLKTAHVTTSQASTRQLHFGITDGRESGWEDCGRPGKALLAFALATHAGYLYAGTCEPGKADTGRVYRHAGGKTWIDCGAPDRSNAVTALAEFQGHLYAGTGKYRVAGSALPESENTQLGGRVFRYDGAGRWADCGQLPDTEAIGGLAVFRGRMYATSLYRPAGFYRYEGGSKWTDCGTPGGKRVVALAVHRDRLYAGSYDGGNVYRYDGKTWADLGRLGENTQTYSFAVYQGSLHVGTWPSGRVYRFEDVGRWKDAGRLGEELEVMGMMVHNGRLLAGSLPRAEVYALADGWKRLARLDETKDVKYRRAWTMAEHDGRLFCATLPSGHVHSFEAGANVTWDHALSNGWRHVVAVKEAGRLRLFLDGRFVAQSAAFATGDYRLQAARPLRIGSGTSGPFEGQLGEVRLYGRALNAEEIRTLTRSLP